MLAITVWSRVKVVVAQLSKKSLLEPGDSFRRSEDTMTGLYFEPS
jgi:hypothetical protein